MKSSWDRMRSKWMAAVVCALVGAVGCAAEESTDLDEKMLSSKRVSNQESDDSERSTLSTGNGQDNQGVSQSSPPPSAAPPELSQDIPGLPTPEQQAQIPDYYNEVVGPCLDECGADLACYAECCIARFLELAGGG